VTRAEVTRVRARHLADLLRALADRLPASLPADAEARVERAIGEAEHHVSVAAIAAGLEGPR